MSNVPNGFGDVLTTDDEVFGAEGDLRTYSELPIEHVEPGPWQPRQVFDADEIAGLAASIERNGQLDPILALHRDGRYFIVAGERRYRALKQLGRTTIEAILIQEDTDEQRLRELAIISNVQRENLAPFEEATSYQTLMDEHQHTLESLGEVLGKKKSTIHDVLLLNDLPAFVREDFRLAGNKVSKSALIEVAREKDQAVRADLWEAIKAGEVRTKRDVRQRKKPTGESKRTIKQKFISDMALISRRAKQMADEGIDLTGEEYGTVEIHQQLLSAYLGQQKQQLGR